MERVNTDDAFREKDDGALSKCIKPAETTTNIDQTTTETEEVRKFTSSSNSKHSTSSDSSTTKAVEAPFVPGSFVALNTNISHCDVNIYSGEIHFPKDNLSGPSDRGREKTSVVRIRQPISHFSPTKKYKNLLQIAKSQSTVILHCHGVPGSGKSEIVRKLGEEFPFTENTKKPLCVKWHIQCVDSGQDIKSELKLLVNQLRKSGILTNDNRYQNVIQNIDNDTASELTKCLEETEVPVLIVIEDMDKNEKSKKFTHDLLRCFNNTKRDHKFHIYMASRKKEAALREAEINKMNYYKLESVNGFEENEGLKFLLGNMSNMDEDDKSAKKVHERFSGSPLGLRAAKGFCKDSKITYKEYLDLLQSDKDFIQAEECASLEKEYGGQVMHVFQAMTMPFQLIEGSDKEDKLILKILYCLSYMNYDRVPRFLLIEYFRRLKEGESESQTISKIKSGKLISKLVEHAMCTVTDEEDITFHEVVTHAFRYASQSESANSFLGEFNPLKEAVQVLAGIVTKDLRSKENSNKMFKLIRHAELLLQHVEDRMKELKKDGEWDLLRLLISHLYETFGAIALSKSPFYHDLADKYLERALEIIGIPKHMKLLKPERDVAAVAERVVETFGKADFRPDFLDDYESKLFINLDDAIQKHLEESCKDMSAFGEVKIAIKKNSGNGKLIKLLRKSEVFLEESKYKNIFYAERIASILHSKSRVVLYEDNPSDYRLEIPKWISSLAHAIAVQCRNVYETGLLMEHLSITGGMIPILLAKKKDLNALMKAKDMCEDMLDKKKKPFDFYEHGLLKEVYGPSHDTSRMQTLRNLVRIYARLLKDRPDTEMHKKGEDHCCELFKLAEKNLKRSAIASLCFVNCGKYYAAVKDFVQAVEYFDKFLQSYDKRRHNVWSWGVYNYARAVREGDLGKRFSQAVKLCEEALDSREAMGDYLNTRLRDELQNLGKLMTSARKGSFDLIN